MIDKSIGKHIRLARLAKKWSQDELAEKTGLSASYIGMLERGQKIPRLETFIALANALNVSADTLLSEVLETGLLVRCSELNDKLSMLSKKDQEQVYTVLDTLIKLKEQ